ncbi:MAG: hypothetical protein LBK95_02205 [Bifidobacteriaceae bacterium]|jgi:hypothetical protein|nr:hypothetical protein [Bifidobacteriaceae bacterium]
MSGASETRTDGGLAGELRNWAKGTRWAGAAVELALAGARGRLVYPGAPWIERLGTYPVGRAHARIDPAKLMAESGPLSSGERLIAKVVANLLDDETLVPLADLSRLDPGQARLVLGALRRAAGLGPAGAKPPAAISPPPGRQTPSMGM